MPENNKQFSIYVPFDLAKTEEQDDGTLMLFGRATQQVKDSQGETFHYDSSVPLFRKRIEENSARSDGRNLMPLRAMHQNIAAGPVVGFDFLDPQKAIDICAHVVDPLEVQKVKTSTYTGFSVGGKYDRRWREGDTVYYTGDPREISLVDAPAVPTARYTMFKMDDQSQDDEEPNDDDQLTVKVDAPKPAWFDVFHKDVQDLAEMRKADKEERDEQLAKLKSIGEHAGISRREGSPLTAPKDYPEDPNEYGDPANWNYSVDEARYDKAIGRFNGGEGEEQYSPSERHNLGRRIARLASRFGDTYQYDPKFKKINRKEVKKMLPKLTPEQLTKLDVNGLKAHLKAVRDAAADAVGKDPEAAKDVMDTLMGNLDALTDPSTAVGGGTTPPVSSGEGTPVAAMKVDAPASSSTSPASTATTATTPTAAKPTEAKAAGAQELGASSTTASPSPSTTTPPTAAKVDAQPEAPITKADVAKIIQEGFKEALTATVAGMKKQAAPVASGDSPLIGMNSLIEKDKQRPGELTLDDVDKAILKALDEGGVYAYPLALKAAGIEDSITGALAPQRVNQAIRKATFSEWTDGGRITKNAYRARLFETQ